MEQGWHFAEGKILCKQSFLKKNLLFLTFVQSLGFPSFLRARAKRYTNQLMDTSLPVQLFYAKKKNKHAVLYGKHFSSTS
jgi:hypothetical protein